MISSRFGVFFPSPDVNGTPLDTIPIYLRHRAATQSYMAMHDLLAVSQFLGHTSVATTQRYVALPVDSLRDMVDMLAIDSA